MGSSEKFCLRWNDFERNISGAFRELREDKDFFDVTLACDDDQIQAHKVILSACSPFFRTILRRNRHEHPLLFLKGVKYVDLVSVLNFMYHGEVNVAQEELNSFLAVAEDLKVKGLTQNNADSNVISKPEAPKPRLRDPPERLEPAPPPKRPRPPPQQLPSRPITTSSSYHSQDDDIQEVVPVKSEPVTQHPEPPSVNHSLAPMSHVDQSYPTQESQVPPMQHDGVVADPSMEYGGDYEEYEGYEGGMDGSYSMMDNSGLGGDGNKEGVHYGNPESLYSEVLNDFEKAFQCNVCSKIAKRKDNILAHIESHLPSVPKTCNYCGKLFKTKNSLTSHVSRWHRLDK